MQAHGGVAGADAQALGDLLEGAAFESQRERPPLLGLKLLKRPQEELAKLDGLAVRGEDRLGELGLGAAEEARLQLGARRAA